MRRKFSLKYDIEVLRSLNKLAMILCILPWYGKNYKHRGRIIYLIFVICIFLAVSVFSIYGIFITTGDDTATTVSITSTACDLMMMITAAGTIIGVNIINGKCVCKFLKELQDIDLQLIAYRRESRYPEYRLYCELIFAHALFVFNYCYNMYVLITLYGIEAMKYSVCRDLQYYYVIVLTMLLRAYANVIRYRLETLNEALIQIGVGINNVYPNVKDATKEVRKLMEVFTLLSSSVKKYNQVFGWQYMTMYIWIGLNILTTIDAFLVYGFGLLILCIAWINVPFIALFSISSACDKGTKAAINTGDICYKLLHDIPKIDRNKELLNEVRNFSVQATSRCPQFAAGGFYDINYGVIFTIGGVVTSYLVVLIQFNK